MELETWNAGEARLEEELQGKLDLTGIEGLIGFAEAGAIQVDIGEIKVHTVEQIEKFSPELQQSPFRHRESEILQE